MGYNDSPLSDERVLCPVHSFDVIPEMDCGSCEEKRVYVDCPFHTPIDNFLFDDDEEEATNEEETPNEEPYDGISFDDL